jgi:hypothetical protein
MPRYSINPSLLSISTRPWYFPRMIRIIVAVLTIFASVQVACETVDPNSAEGTFARLGPCIDLADRSCMYELLDRDGRWSIQTIQRTLAEMRHAVEQSYPASLQQRAYGRWSAETLAKTPPELFSIYCKRNHCFDKISSGFGAIVSRKEVDASTVELETTRGQKFVLRVDAGRWGISLFTKDLLSEKIRLLDRLKQINKSAREFDEQRQAGSAEDFRSDKGGCP